MSEQLEDKPAKAVNTDALVAAMAEREAEREAEAENEEEERRVVKLSECVEMAADDEVSGARGVS